MVGVGEKKMREKKHDSEKEGRGSKDVLGE